MAREQFQSLTEQMYYILLALLEPRCGVDISQKAMEISRGRMQIGPGTLYTLLAKFEKEDMIKEAGVEGRRKYYQITDHGLAHAPGGIPARLETLVEEGREYMREAHCSGSPHGRRKPFMAKIRYKFITFREYETEAFAEYLEYKAAKGWF